MKINFLLSFFMLIVLSTSSAYAGFPVLKSAEKSSTEMVSSENNEDAALITPAAAYGTYNKWIALALWFFLGGFAAHRWYAKKPAGWNILFILTLGGLMIWAIVDLINILVDNFE